jgi:hypothetical protein
MRPFKIIFLIVALSLMTGGSAYSYNWINNPANNHKYALTETAKNWEACEAEANNAGGHLVSITNAAENYWVRNNLGTGDYWIGFFVLDRGSQYNYSRRWYWSDWSNGFCWTFSTPLYYFYVNWAPGEPNNRDGVNLEEFAMMRSDGCWNDIMGTYVHYGVIEVPFPHVVPLPGAVWLLGSGLLGLVGWRRFRKS